MVMNLMMEKRKKRYDSLWSILMGGCCVGGRSDQVFVYGRSRNLKGVVSLTSFVFICSQPFCARMGEMLNHHLFL